MVLKILLLALMIYKIQMKPLIPHLDPRSGRKPRNSVRFNIFIRQESSTKIYLSSKIRLCFVLINRRRTICLGVENPNVWKWKTHMNGHGENRNSFTNPLNQFFQLRFLYFTLKCDAREFKFWSRNLFLIPINCK